MALMSLFSGQQWRNRHREQTYEHGGEGRREKVRVCMYGESNMETYIIICKIESQREFAYVSGDSQGLCINLEG